MQCSHKDCQRVAMYKLLICFRVHHRGKRIYGEYRLDGPSYCIWHCDLKTYPRSVHPPDLLRAFRLLEAEGYTIQSIPYYRIAVLNASPLALQDVIITLQPRPALFASMWGVALSAN